MADGVSPELARFINEEHLASGLPTSRRELAEGEPQYPVFVENGRASEFLRVAAKRAAGLFRTTKCSEVVWVQADIELAVNLVDLYVKLSDSLIGVLIPVRCDQTGSPEAKRWME